MIEFLKKYYLHIIGVILFLGLVYLTVYLATPEPDMSELDKYKLEQIDKDINLILENQKKLDKQIEGYKNEISKIDSTIAQVKNQKTVVREYYRDLGEKVDKMKKKEIDSFFHARYSY
jgi:septal ring factor EnvC (AmiA/AmiB activator)